jgi:hypothetical protein
LGEEIGCDFHIDVAGLIWLIIYKHMPDLPPRQIEAATALGWPAQDETNIAGWRVFSGLGPVGRVNSCWPLVFDGDDVEAAIDQVEAHYRAKMLPPQFKLIVNDAAPAGLYDRLIARGYQTHQPRGGDDGQQRPIAAPTCRLHYAHRNSGLRCRCH